jgi:cellobiose-specific phosphotransferase system component IIC
MLNPICSHFNILNYWLLLCIALLVFALAYAPFFAMADEQFKTNWAHLMLLKLKLTG